MQGEHDYSVDWWICLAAALAAAVARAAGGWDATWPPWGAGAAPAAGWAGPGWLTLVRFLRFMEMDLLRLTWGSAAMPVIHGCTRICDL